MDSRLIHKTSEHLKHDIDWLKPGESEWIYCGSEGEVNFDMIKNELGTFFNEGKYYVVTTRAGSYETDSGTLLGSVSDKIGVIDFYIWNENFQKVVEFNKIGVFRKGISAANIGLPK